ncbi:MAG TPA: AprI/Inh family metalloprotease inhibitor [Caulobacteraceae bacterium]|jgi:hypothetical protein
MLSNLSPRLSVTGLGVLGAALTLACSPGGSTSAVASTPIPPDPTAFTGGWTLHRGDGGAASCPLVLLERPAHRPPRTGRAVEASPACLARLGLNLALWRAEGDGLVLDGEDAADVLLFAQRDARTYVARGSDGRVRYVLVRRAR